MSVAPTWTERDELNFRLLDERIKTQRERDELAFLCTENFKDFVKEAWSTVEPSKAYIENWHIGCISEHLEAVTAGQIKRLLINIGPGYAKSLLVSVLWPAWWWTKDARMRFMCSSYAESLSLRDAVRCRALIESPWYQELFRPKWRLRGDTNKKELYETTLSGSRFSHSVGSKATGFRAMAQIIDDPTNVKDQYSDKALEEVTTWLDNTMSSRFNDQATGVRVIIMQRLSERDLSAHVLAQGGYEHVCLPSEFEPERRCRTSIGFEDPRTEFGELLFPALFGHEVIEQAKRDMGSTSYNGQHQQRPVPAGGGMLKSFWWNYWQPRGANLPPVPVKMPDGSYVHRAAVLLPMDMDLTIQSWDMAFKDTPKSDFVVGLALAARGADRFVLDMERGRMDLPETLMAVRRLSARQPAAQTKLVEDKANGSAVIQSLRHEIGGLTEVKPEGNKQSRASGASPMLESGNWYLPHPSLMPWVADFLKETSDFPAGLNDDIVDAWSQGANRLLSVPPKRSREVVLPARVFSGPTGWMV